LCTILGFKREKLGNSKEVTLGLRVFGEGSLEIFSLVGKHL